MPLDNNDAITCWVCLTCAVVIANITENNDIFSAQRFRILIPPLTRA